MPLRTCLLAFLATSCAAAQTQPPTRDLQIIRVPRRHAFVVGNSLYINSSPLKNPANDAEDVAASLRRLGFQVSVEFNLSLSRFEAAFDAFTPKVGKGDLALVYFAGHGVQIDGENYLVPVDFKAATKADVKYKAFSATRLRERLEETGAAVRVMILDACRNNPYSPDRSLGGLAAMPIPPQGTIIAFSANDKEKASDNPSERNGLYTKFLLRGLEQPGLHLKEIFERTQAEVYEASGRSQFPALYSAVIGRLILKEGRAPARPPSDSPAGAGPPLNEEDAYWRQCESSKGAFCEAYLKRFPNGRFADLAKLILKPAPEPPKPASNSSPAPKTGQRDDSAADSPFEGLPGTWSGTHTFTEPDKTGTPCRTKFSNYLTLSVPSLGEGSVLKADLSQESFMTLSPIGCSFEAGRRRSTARVTNTFVWTIRPLGENQFGVKSEPKDCFGDGCSYYPATAITFTLERVGTSLEIKGLGSPVLLIRR